MLIFRDLVIIVIVTAILETIKEKIPIESKKVLISIVSQSISAIAMILQFAIALMVIWAIVETALNGGDYNSIIEEVWTKIK